MLTEALLNPAPASPFLTLGTNQMQAIRTHLDLFNVTIPGGPHTSTNSTSTTSPFAAHTNTGSEDNALYLHTICEGATTVTTSDRKGIAYNGC